MNKEMDVVLTKTKICHKARLEVLLIGVVCCVLLACTLLYVVLQRPQSLNKKKEAFSLHTYVSETSYPVKIICYAKVPRMDLKDYKAMIAGSVDTNNVVVPKDYTPFVKYDDMKNMEDVSGIIHYEFYKDEEHNFVALVMNRIYGENPYVEDLKQYSFKDFRNYRMIINREKDKPASYYTYAFHRIKSYKYNILVEVERDEEVVQFIESFYLMKHFDVLSCI